MSATRSEHDQRFAGSMGGGLPSLVAAAHELKAPLALIRQLSLSLDDCNFSLQEQKRMLQQISLTSESALRLTSDLTRSARLADGLFKLEPINPQQLCEDIVRELTPFFTAHDCKVKLQSRKHQLLLIANRDLLRRIIMNFSDNALHYTDDHTTVEIQIRALYGGKIVRLGVRDYGPALSVNVLNSLQNRLVDASTTIDSRPQSSGLGLYIARQFADAMNGKIGVKRHRDGSTFFVDLQASNQLSLL